jgi:hypothetical protein
VSDSRDILNTAAELRGRASRLREIAESLEGHAEELERGVAGASGEAVVLHGADISEKAADLMEPGQVLHFTDMERLLRSAGFVVYGKVPTNTLLATLQRSPQFERVRARSGRYRRVAA